MPPWTTRRRGAGSAHRSSGIGEITSPVTSNCLRSLSWCEIAPGRQPAAPMPAQHCTRPRRVHSRPLCTRVRQLLSGTYAVGPRSLHCGGFGLLCGCGALIGLAAAHTCSRPLLYLVRRSPHAHRALIPRLPPSTHSYTPLGAWAACTLLVTSNPNPTRPCSPSPSPNPTAARVHVPRRRGRRSAAPRHGLAPA